MLAGSETNFSPWDKLCIAISVDQLKIFLLWSYWIHDWQVSFEGWVEICILGSWARLESGIFAINVLLQLEHYDERTGVLHYIDVVEVCSFVKLVFPCVICDFPDTPSYLRSATLHSYRMCGKVYRTSLNKLFYCLPSQLVSPTKFACSSHLYSFYLKEKMTSPT